MEHYLGTQYMSDLRELIFLKQHDVVRELARQQVVKENFVESLLCDEKRKNKSGNKERFAIEIKNTIERSE